MTVTSPSTLFCDSGQVLCSGRPLVLDSGLLFTGHAPLGSAPHLSPPVMAEAHLATPFSPFPLSLPPHPSNSTVRRMVKPTCVITYHCLPSESLPPG